MRNVLSEKHEERQSAVETAVRSYECFVAKTGSNGVGELSFS